MLLQVNTCNLLSLKELSRELYIVLTAFRTFRYRLSRCVNFSKMLPSPILNVVLMSGKKSLRCLWFLDNPACNALKRNFAKVRGFRVAYENGFSTRFEEKDADFGVGLSILVYVSVTFKAYIWTQIISKLIFTYFLKKFCCVLHIIPTESSFSYRVARI